MADDIVSESEEETPSKRYLVMDAGYLRCRIARDRFDGLTEKLEKLRDSPKAKESPEEYAIEVVLKAMTFNKQKTIEKKTNLPLIKTPPLEDVVEAMVEHLLAALEYEDDTGQTKMTEHQE